MERVLVIDDDKLIRITLSQILSSLGCQVDTAEDGVFGVKAFSDAMEEGNPYQLIYCDMMMPRMDGQATIVAIRELEKKAGIPQKNETQIVMVSSMEDPKYIVAAMYEGGAQNYLTKPFSEEEVASEVTRIRKLRERKLLSDKKLGES